MSDWTDAIVGERMTVDREFTDRLRQSEFSNQEWGLIMTAVEFEIEDADDPENARIVADTSKLPQIIPELDNISQQMGAMSGADPSGDSSGGAFGEIVSDIKDALLGGGGSGVDDQTLEAAEGLTQEYADELQRHLESKGKFEQVRLAYQE
ncbi:DUF5799 family protein [Halobaculum gomorrense]|uniref:Uncharacterized protein n=1 Tax=Halobaculum gomorrense TaxID=43928 RepID=A0A1M5TRB6_9EURY|nr:DUF5799 family protein [Halobaculum gomorrense]SHH53146.1 hypothetical protein SAMN05443636_2808 [Halobaculum gomorrense]